LLLLRHGGRTVFFGPVSQLIPYFEAVPGVRPITPGTNAANWMLECIGAFSIQATLYRSVLKLTFAPVIVMFHAALPLVSRCAP
jgi:hypothetical protein